MTRNLYYGCKIKQLIAITKINAVKNLNENTMKRQQSFFSLIFETRFHLSNKIKD